MREAQSLLTGKAIQAFPARPAVAVQRAKGPTVPAALARIHSVRRVWTGRRAEPHKKSPLGLIGKRSTLFWARVNRDRFSHTIRLRRLKATVLPPHAADFMHEERGDWLGANATLASSNPWNAFQSRRSRRGTSELTSLSSTDIAWSG